MNLENVTRDDWIVGGLALLLAISLLFFPWFSISVSIGAFSGSLGIDVVRFRLSGHAPG